MKGIVRTLLRFTPPALSVATAAWARRARDEVSFDPAPVTVTAP